jgi:hypothetical protein
MLDLGFNITVVLCILALTILLIITRIVRSFRRAQCSRAVSSARERSQCPDLPHRMPDLNTIRFLLQIGHCLVAIRYYRDCTGASITLVYNQQTDVTERQDLARSSHL